MGYYTAYSLSVEPDQGFEDDEGEFYEELVLVAEHNGEGESVKELIQCGATYAKLYDIESYISQVAKKYPHLLIILDGDGEESDDLWEMRWRGDVSERQDAVIPPFTRQELIGKHEKINTNNS